MITQSSKEAVRIGDKRENTDLIPFFDQLDYYISTQISETNYKSLRVQYFDDECRYQVIIGVQHPVEVVGHKASNIRRLQNEISKNFDLANVVVYIEKASPSPVRRQRLQRPQRPPQPQSIRPEQSEIQSRTEPRQLRVQTSSIRSQLNRQMTQVSQMSQKKENTQNNNSRWIDMLKHEKFASKEFISWVDQLYKK